MSRATFCLLDSLSSFTACSLGELSIGLFSLRRWAVTAAVLRSVMQLAGSFPKFGSVEKTYNLTMGETTVAYHAW